jgi:hypothetical protein
VTNLEWLFLGGFFWLAFSLDRLGRQLGGVCLRCQARPSQERGGEGRFRRVELDSPSRATAVRGRRVPPQARRRRCYHAGDLACAVADGTMRRLREHIEVIARAYGIGIVYTDQEQDWRADWEGRRVCIPPVRDWQSYCVALHEVGHFASGGDSDCRGWKGEVKHANDSARFS